MKKIKNLSFTGIILIPAKNKFQEKLPHSVCPGALESSGGCSSSLIYVMVFNCDKTEEIIPLIDLEIREAESQLKEYPGKKIFTNQLEFFSNLKKDLGDSLMKHDVPEELLDELYKTGEFGKLKKEEVIYLSGVSSLVEI